MNTLAMSEIEWCALACEGALILEHEALAFGDLYEAARYAELAERMSVQAFEAAGVRS